MGKQPISKARLPGEKLLESSDTFRGLVLEGRTGGQTENKFHLSAACHLDLQLILCLQFWDHGSPVGG
jgi:hypothetical protein